MDDLDKILDQIFQTLFARVVIDGTVEFTSIDEAKQAIKEYTNKQILSELDEMQSRYMKGYNEATKYWLKKNAQLRRDK